MLKTPISILQELAVQKKLPLPDYQISGSGESHIMAFTCNVKIGKEEATGTGLTKKEAKHNAASKLLESFGVKMKQTQEIPSICLLPTTKTRRDLPVINFVGKLNEFSSQNGYAQPIYHDNAVLTSDAQFCVICNFDQFETKGYGKVKKEAKQDSAKKMLTLLKEKDIGHALHASEFNPLNNASEPNNGGFEKILQTYTDIIKNMSIDNCPHIAMNNNNDLDLGKKSYIDIKNWDELIIYMDSKGWRHEVTVLQPSPLMLCLKINHNTLLNFGRTREEIYGKFVQTVIRMLEEGTDFNEPLLQL